MSSGLLRLPALARSSTCLGDGFLVFASLNLSTDDVERLGPAAGDGDEQECERRTRFMANGS